MSVTATRVEWIPQEDYERAVLTVSGPKDVLLQEEVGAGRSPSLELFDSSGNPLPDGMYTYELRAVSRKKADGAPPELRQSGYLAIRDGSFLLMDASEPAKTPERPPIKHVTSELTTIPDDLLVTGKLIVQGGGGYGACIGDGCTSSDYGIPLMLKSGYLQIRFDDIPSFGNPVHDWLLQANDNIGPGEYFTLLDGEAATRPFTVEGYAPDASLYVRSNGNVGLGTATPATRLDVKANSAGQAVARFQNSSATGYSGTEYLDNAGNVDLFFGVDNAASTTRLNSVNNNPIVILTNSTERMRVNSAGDVGIGTASPAAAVHITRSIGSLATLARFSNNSGIQVLYDRTDAGANDWQTSNFNSTFQISIPGSSPAQFSLGSDGNLTIGGTQYLTGSSRDLKENFVPVDGGKILRRLAEMPLTEWNAKDVPGQRHIGPIAEDWWATFELGPDDKHVSTTDVGGVALAAIQGLYQLVRDKDEEVATLRRENSDLAERLGALEKMVSGLVEEATEAKPAP